MLGLGQLTVEVAGGSDSRVVIGYLSTDRLEELRDRILDLAAGAADAAGAAEADAADADGAAGLDADVDHAGPADSADSAGPARRPAPLGFEDAVGASPLRSAGGREEHPLYTVGPAILIGSILRSVTTLWAVLIVIVILAAAIAAIVARGVSAMGAGFLLSAVAGPAAIVGAVWGQIGRAHV